MKKKTVVLCELCAHDELATNVLNIGVCGPHDEKLNALREVSSLPVGNGEVNGNGRKRRKNLSAAEKKQMKELRNSGVALKKVSEMFQVSPSTVTRYANSAK